MQHIGFRALALLQRGVAGSPGTAVGARRRVGLCSCGDPHHRPAREQATQRAGRLTPSAIARARHCRSGDGFAEIASVRPALCAPAQWPSSQHHLRAFLTDHEQGVLVLPPVGVGMIAASATRRPPMPSPRASARRVCRSDWPSRGRHLLRHCQAHRRCFDRPLRRGGGPWLAPPSAIIAMRP